VIHMLQLPTRGASFATKSRGPWKLIYYEAYTEREDAEGRERFYVALQGEGQARNALSGSGRPHEQRASD